MELAAHVSLETSFSKVSDFSPVYSNNWLGWVQAGLDMLSATFTLRCQMSRDSALYVFITEQPMANLKGLYNIKQLVSRCLTHYTISNNWISDVFVAKCGYIYIYIYSENGFPILLVTIWCSEHLIESVITQNIAISSYMDPQNWNLSQKNLTSKFFVKPPDPPPPHHPCVQDIDPEHLLEKGTTDEAGQL
jgi:hypothetical protein